MSEERKRRSKPAKPDRAQTQEVNYIPPAPINRKQVILIAASVIAVAVAIFLGLSIFFKVDKQQFQVQGNRIYRADRIWEASGIKDGDSLLAFGKAKAASRIMQQLPYVKSVRIQITLPDIVTVYIEEHKVYLVAQDTNEDWWFLSTDGKILEKTDEEEAAKRTALKGFLLKPPAVGQMAEAAELLPDENTQNPPVVTFSEADKLKTALETAVALEKTGILGEIRNVDVSDMNGITFWYVDRFLVELGDAGRIADKIALIETAISTQLGPRDTGVLTVISEENIQIEFERRNFE